MNKMLNVYNFHFYSSVRPVYLFLKRRNSASLSKSQTLGQTLMANNLFGYFREINSVSKHRSWNLKGNGPNGGPKFLQILFAKYDSKCKAYILFSFFSTVGRFVEWDSCKLAQSMDAVFTKFRSTSFDTSNLTVPIPHTFVRLMDAGKKRDCCTG